MCIGRVWGTVCDPWYFGWSYGFAHVVCRQMGFEVDQGPGTFNDSMPIHKCPFHVIITNDFC